MWPNPQKIANFVIFTKQILNGKLHFLSRDNSKGVFKTLWNIYDEAF